MDHRGRVAHVWAVEQTRLERREIEWFRLAAEIEAAGIRALDTNRDGVVRVRDEVSAIEAVLAAAEVGKLKQRTRDRLEARTCRAASGLEAVRLRATVDGAKTYVVVEEQADAIKWAAEQVLSGWSLSNVARELNARGVKSARGKEIQAITVKQILHARTIAGYRVHRSETLVLRGARRVRGVPGTGDRRRQDSDARAQSSVLLVSPLRSGRDASRCRSRRQGVRQELDPHPPRGTADLDGTARPHCAWSLAYRPRLPRHTRAANKGHHCPGVEVRAAPRVFASGVR